jgi:hypothetical protein
MICNVTDPTVPGCIMEPFNVTTLNASGTPVPTVLELHLTGIRATTAAALSVIIGTTVINADRNLPSDQPGFDLLTFTLPLTVNGGADLPVVVRLSAATSRPTPGDNPPLVAITPGPSPSPSP